MAHTPKNQSEKAILTARRAWCYLVLVLISFLCLFFFYVLIINSTRTHFEIQKGFSLMPGKSIITNFRNVLTDANIPVVSGIRNTLADARRYIVENDLKHVQIIGDFYHMNIEEDNLAQALHDNRDLLGHVHIADNHRYQPGSGTLDFHALFEQLRADNYQGYVVYEGRIRAEDPAQAYRDSLAWLRTC